MRSPDEIEQGWTLDQVDLAHRWLDAIEIATEKAIEESRRRAEHERGR